MIVVNSSAMVELHNALPEVLRSAMIDALPTIADGRVSLAPESASTGYGSLFSASIVVEVDGDPQKRFDVSIGSVYIRNTVPPGWANEPQYAVRDIIRIRHSPNEPWVEHEVVAILGSRSDPRPGYVVTPLTRNQDGTYIEDGTRDVMEPNYLHSIAEYVGKRP